jgi:hypothetical protein
MNFFKSKNKKPKLVKPPEPRSVEELTKIHNDLCNRAGVAQYIIAQHQAEITKINEALQSINNEAAARKEQDAKAAPKEESPVNEQA